MRLLIVEPEATGHHMALYVRLLVRAAIARQWHVQLLTTRRAINHAAFKLVEDEGLDNSDIFFMSEVTRSSRTDPVTLFLRQESYYRAISEGFRKLEHDQAPDVIYMTNLDYFDKILALRGSPFGTKPFVGMMMKVEFHRHKMHLGQPSKSDWLEERLFRRLLRIPTLKRAVVIDECFFSYTQKSKYKEYQKIHFAPDVGELSGNELRELARMKLGIPQKNFVILVYGTLKPRKGIKELLQAVKVLGKSEVSILLAGRQSEKMQEIIRSSLAQHPAIQGNLFESTGFHDEKHEYRVFKAADAVWVGYDAKFYGSSGVMLQAGSMSLPVLATCEGLIGWLTNQHGLGITFNPKSCHAAAAAINKLLVDKELRKQLGRKGYIFSRKHSSDKFGDALCSAIAAASLSNNSKIFSHN